ncbi:MAG: thiol:disulfide interchange protein DsbA/DsbL [Methylococcales bacterium]|nr:thiol:disulfide interchange protein DsbA/DsbL [Methylococcales bacterium]
MFKRIIFFFLFSFSALLYAEGKGYELISPPQPVNDTSKVEVLEFFWYGCPHCYHLEPQLDKWLAKKPDNVNYIRQPAAFNQQWADHAKAYFIAESLGVVDQVHADFFDAIQNKKQKLQTESQLADFFVAHGVDREKFVKTFKSFLIDTKVRQAKKMPARYGITGVPVLIVNGKYKISSKSAGSQENMIKVLKELIIKESTPAK